MKKTINSMDELEIRDGDTEDIPVIGYLAQNIWPVAYKEILTKDQLDYMLNYIYSPKSLLQQMTEQNHKFLIAELDEEPVGFASFSKIIEPDIYKLHKLYVRTDIQGKGLGKALLEEVINHIMPASALHLNVNRFNKARFFYEKLGFRILKEEDVDIGNGYFMIDYVMEKKF